MAVMELLPQLRQLSRADKLYLIQELVPELAAEQANLIKPDLSYPIWSPIVLPDIVDGQCQQLAYPASCVAT